MRITFDLLSKFIFVNFQDDTNFVMIEIDNGQIVRNFDDEIFKFNFVNKKKNNTYKELKANKDEVVRLTV